MNFIKIKNWDEYQHYKDRSAPWIKLHKEILSSHFWVMGSDASKLLAICIMLLAQRNDNKIPADPVYIKRFGHLETEPDFQPLIDAQLIEIVDDAGCQQDASMCLATCPPEERERREENTLSGNPDDTPETPKPKKPTFTKEAQEVLSYLNGVVGSRFEPVPANIGLITARLKDGATVESMKAVIDRKHREWATDGEMSKYLRPATLFNATKFAQYAGESGPASTENPAIRELMAKHGTLKRLPNGGYLAPNGQRYTAEGKGGACI